MDVKKQAAWLDLDYKPKLPRDKTMGIGIVGAGGIVTACQLPAYRIAGFAVVGIYDVDYSKAQTVAQEFGIKHIFRTLEELLAHPEIMIVDIAIPAQLQPVVVEQVVARGKHVLCQKPMAESYSEAKRIVDACDKAGVKAAINQQMRWAPSIRASYNIIQRGWMGTLTQASIQVNVLTKFDDWEWLRGFDKLEIMYHSIHYMDSLRFLMGTPEYIYADGARYPEQICKGETRTMIHMKFAGETRGLIHDNHNNWANKEDWYATYRIEGTDGMIKGINGALYNYPVGREDTLLFISKQIDPDCWFTPQLEGKWLPHGFIGTMGELMRSIEEDREPENSVRDNLLTIQMLFAAYRSIEENRPVRLEEIQS